MLQDKLEKNVARITGPVGMRNAKLENHLKRARPGKQLEKMSFEDVRNALLVAYGDGFLDDEEFLFLYDFYESVNPSYPYWDFDTFCLD